MIDKPKTIANRYGIPANYVGYDQINNMRTKAFKAFRTSPAGRLVNVGFRCDQPNLRNWVLIRTLVLTHGPQFY